MCARRGARMQPRIPEVTLLEELGRGPGSIVFRGLHHGTGCTVKLPSDRPATPSAEAFEQDLLQFARLSRAGLPRVVQIGATDDTAYAILDEAEGEPLAQLLQRSLSEHTALQVGLKLVACLRQLHDAGVVHGDLTLEHIVLSSDGTQLSLLDRGSVARPAQFDPRVDTQALGAVLRECARHAEPQGTGALRLMRLAEELALAERVDLATATAELETCLSSGFKRNSAYPAPSVESLASLPVPAAHPRRARSELVQLQRAWDRAVHGQSGVVIGVLGAAGSGKTRLLAAFLDSLSSHDVPVLSVRCRNSDWAPFSALKRLLDGHLAGLAALEPSRRAEIEASLRTAAGPLASRARLLSPRLAELFRDAPITIGEGDAQQVFVAGMADFLAKYLEWSGRSVVVIDDVHWLDASSRLVLSRLASRVCPQGHMFVCGARDDTESREPLERFRAALLPEFIETLRLGSLTVDDASQVIAEYLGLDRTPAELADQLTQLSDGTPLCLLELLRSTLERGLLKPLAGSWHLDAAQVQSMRLPASSRALIEQRLAKLDPVELRVLRAAAVLRDHIDVKLLARVADLGQADVQHALDCTVSARLLELDPDGVYGFVHDTVWEALLRELPDDARRGLHQQVADVLFADGGEGADFEYEVARHHAAGLVASDPARVFETNRRAARRALEACDDALALSFLRPAEQAAELAGLYPGRELFVQLAETYLRTGDTQQSLAYFERALVCSKPGFERAHVRGRMAWIHHFNANATACHDALEIALAESGKHYPANHAGGLVMAAGRWAAGSLRGVLLERFAPRRKRTRQDPASQSEAQALCQLYTECFRVAFDSGSPFGVMTSVLSLAGSSRELQPCRAVVHADLLMALFFSTLGLSQIAQARFERAEQMARELGDPIAQTLVHAVLHAITGWRGDLAESEREAKLCVDERGHWMELGELCYVCFALYGVEIARGRPEAALAWIERAVERVRQNGRAPAIFALIEDAAIVTRIMLGREREIRSLERRLRFVEHAELKHDGYFHVLLYQTRVQRFTETGNLGAEFEALVDEFDALQLNPRHVHLLVTAYYAHVAHARVHQCLRAESGARAALLPKLERACRDLAAAGGRVKNSEGHLYVVRAAQRFFLGDLAGAKRLAADAEHVAEQHGWPWVMWAASRLRAHMLRAEGDEAAARDRARIAALWAQRYGQQSRLRFICEEFAIDDVPGAFGRTDVDAPSTRRNLDALARISEANSRELGAERQARLILDELLEALAAERAFLFMRSSEPGRPFSLAAGRRAGAGDLAASEKYDRGLVEQVYATGQTQLLEGAPGDRAGTERACIAVALVSREQAVGVLYLDRPEVEGSFRSEDAALLQALAHQVSLALELGSSLREREQLQHTLQQAQTMEAIGRLAGGIAHDFNNILAAIQYAASSLVVLAAQGKVGREDLEDIQGAARRGADLTRQLLGLSRGKTSPPPPRRIVLGEAVRDLLPMLRRLVRHDVRIIVELASESLAIMADLSQIERVLMNLCQNASDAMPHGGSITIRIAPLALEHGACAVAGTSHVLLSVADTGTGMNDEVRSRLFEPFFTTKANHRGTGLGLANVYTIVQHCQGTIEVTSELGAGSCFRISLPRTPAPEQAPAPLRFLSEVRPTAAANSSKAILVVDDDDAVRRMVVRTLELGGFRVLAAPNGQAALRIADSHGGLFNLVVTDMHMPGMDGSQLGRALLERDPGLKLLYLSGDASDALEESGLLSRDAAFLHKPFPPDLLLSQVRAALSDEVPSAPVRDSVG
jgi:signal transduction histidine kinase/CheY-like chemotaxis protein